VNDQITFNFGPTYWEFRANIIAPDYIELECIEAHHVHDGLPSSITKEWEGTILKWKIQKQDENTKITLTHQGLIPSIDCYEICEEGWDYFFVQSFKMYLDEGKGMPYEGKL